MIDTARLLVFAGATIVLAVTPGPDILYTLTRGITQGRRAAMYAAMGFNLGVIFHTLLAALGVSAILRTSAVAYQGIKLAGAAYLIYIGIQTWRSQPADVDDGGKDYLSPQAIFRQTIIGNILNPKVALFFLAFLPQFVDPAQGHPGLQTALFGLLFMLVSFPVFATVALFSGAIGDRLRRNQAIESRLKKIAGAVLVLLGFALAVPENLW
jgi:threonine/homoserine/homoserine lactone efflux protein